MQKLKFRDIAPCLRQLVYAGTPSTSCSRPLTYTALLTSALFTSALFTPVFLVYASLVYASLVYAGHVYGGAHAYFDMWVPATNPHSTCDDKIQDCTHLLAQNENVSGVYKGRMAVRSIFSLQCHHQPTHPPTYNPPTTHPPIYHPPPTQSPHPPNKPYQRTYIFR